MKALQPNEDRIKGQWIKVDGKIVEDAVARRIHELIASTLTKLAESENGWDSLYLDRTDGRMWELTYPHSEWHGGGPPLLQHVPPEYAALKYKIAPDSDDAP